MSNRLAVEQSPLHQVQLLDHHRVEIIQALPPRPLRRILRDRQGLDGPEHFLLETVTVLHIGPRGGLLALLLVGSAPAGQPRQADHLGFEFTAPVLALAPTAQCSRLHHGHQQVRTFALCIPQEAHIGWEMHVGLQHIAVSLGADRLNGTVFFFLKAARPAWTTSALIWPSNSSSTWQTFSERVL